MTYDKICYEVNLPRFGILFATSVVWDVLPNPKGDIKDFIMSPLSLLANMFNDIPTARTDKPEIAAKAAYSLPKPPKLLWLLDDCATIKIWTNKKENYYDMSEPITIIFSIIYGEI